MPTLRSRSTFSFPIFTTPVFCPKQLAPSAHSRLKPSIGTATVPISSILCARFRPVTTFASSRNYFAWLTIGPSGAHPIYCQEAANPAIYKPFETSRDYEVTFVGQAYGNRPMFIQFLVQNGIAVHTWGHGWKNPDRRHFPKETYDAIRAIPEYLRDDPLPDEELVKMYSRSNINLGFSSCGDTHLTNPILQVRLRDFEVPMSGGFYMVERIDELAEFFDLQNEVVCYQGREDLLKKVRHYLAYPAEREKIRAAGHARAQRDHSWQRRFQKAFAEMGLA